MKKFTLIELIIACAIFGILVSILLPSISNAREKAKIAVCLSNQKQVATAYNLYSTVNNGLTPWSRMYYTYAGTVGSSIYARDAVEERPLNEFLSNPKVAWCPSDKGEPPGGNYHMGQQFGVSFQTEHIDWKILYINLFTSGPGGAWSNYNSLTEAQKIASRRYVKQIENPAKKGLYHFSALRPDRDWFVDPRGTMRRHDFKDPRYTIGFADGHAVYFNFWMKKDGKSYNPASGKTLQWRWDNLNLY